ncbi:MAG: hypothetical protein EXX96DRAFT_573698 [Benjaminiella poitrasii]|nr:MAG: hypothetical protein EXX96DRAFT_573698 [Benjaminiella poitrasii]
MQSWTDKSNSSSLRYDKTLSNVNQYQQPESSTTNNNSSNRFRTTYTNTTATTTTTQQNEDNRPSPSLPLNTIQFTQQPSSIQQHRFAQMPPTDGSDVLAFLNTPNYTDHVHQDDLNPSSTVYTSYRHQIDHQQARQEQLSQLLVAEDIVEYLITADYIEDLYGLPQLGQIVKEAKEELTATKDNRGKAIQRLDMIRQHLLKGADGNPDLAAQQAMTTDFDWISL